MNDQSPTRDPFVMSKGLKFPKRIHCGPTKGELVWERLTVGRASQVLHSPRYAGAYAFGRSRITMGPEGASIARELPIEQWHTLIPGAHAAYITWEDYKRNLGQLESNAQGGARNRACPPREGPALLQGLAVCGLCGRRMTVRYRNCRGVLHPQYVCDGRNKGLGMPKCQSISGQTIDEAVGTLLLEAVTPMALDVSLAVHDQATISLHCGLRFSEIAKLRWSNIDLENEVMQILDPKDESRHAFITAPVKMALNRLNDLNNYQLNDLIFGDKNGNQQQHVSNQ